VEIWIWAVHTMLWMNGTGRSASIEWPRGGVDASVSAAPA
jgi:hypothetical protein